MNPLPGEIIVFNTLFVVFSSLPLFIFDSIVCDSADVPEASKAPSTPTILALVSLSCSRCTILYILFEDSSLYSCMRSAKVFGAGTDFIVLFVVSLRSFEIPSVEEDEVEKPNNKSIQPSASLLSLSCFACTAFRKDCSAEVASTRKDLALSRSWFARSSTLLLPLFALIAFSIPILPLYPLPESLLIVFTSLLSLQLLPELKSWLLLLPVIVSDEDDDSSRWQRI
mmetsp:Transcript_24021/g.50663  ORF Transcript_24021/g.50663 Transcript_24021/m.50663 type:complete len:226 (+) Transcript_24021:1851-2528(+)